MKTFCVTAICGGYDILSETLPSDDGTTYVCFTDNPAIQCSRWEVRPACKEFTGRWDGNVRNAKRHKILIHEYIYCDYSLWVDGHATLLKPPTALIKTYIENTDYDIVIFKHWGRECVYDEAETCIQLGLDKEEIMRNQMAVYEAEGYPRKAGLNAGGIILRRHSEKVQEFNEFWWDQVCQHSKRDQLSLNYSIWKTGIKVGTFCPYPGNDFVRHRTHGR